MIIRKLGRGFVVCLFVIGLTGVIQAIPITGLFATGVDGTGTGLANPNGATDTHYMILSGPGIVSPQNAVTFNCCYFANTSTSDWISVNANGSTGPFGTYIFELTFSLAGLDPSSAQITGRFAADDHVTATKINGNTVAGATENGFGSFVNFSIPVGSGFIAGVNKLDFTVQDDFAPMAFRAELSGTANPLAAVPEPGTWGLGFAGMAALLFGARARKLRV